MTQNNPKGSWAKIPLQNFSVSSDINWAKTITEIDRQLYEKYGLDKCADEECDLVKFIEDNVLPMY